MKVYAQQCVWADSIELRVGKDINRKFYVATPIQFELHKAEEVSEPCITLLREEAQSWIDALYSVGLRPSQAVGSAGQLDAVKYHLEDMRKLVFK